MATSSTPASRSQPNTPPPGTPSASRPPSRHSTRITTPVRNDPNFVRPSKDSRKALPPSSATQMSARQTRKRPLRCNNPYRKGVGTRANLVKHRDGNANREPCPGRARAIAAGCKLPMTVKEKKAQKNGPEQVAMRKMVDGNNFDNNTFNQLLVLWIVRHLLPWLRIEDFILGIAFRYLRHVAKPYTRVWAATEAHRLYCHLQSKVLDTLQESLIASYGIRWNIKFESRERGYIARNVINKLIENKRDRQEHEGGKNHFNEYEITQSDWDIVNKLNDIISEFYYITKKMEGDIPSASMVLAKYRLLRQYLEGKLSTITEDEFKNMINTMLKKKQHLRQRGSCIRCHPSRHSSQPQLPSLNDPEVVPLSLPPRAIPSGRPISTTQTGPQ
ncbi:hypothetical protein PGT21_012916 [Puccinia graminis f. sp. tritici]|uniref:Uncharacterized protein n=1 Tax=Puccinia graminis f. sp. tritici TaxID=56615 RepID=A0A5B0P470_PUCGR|nr:hypothetical protein PGT21_012916 [Puccinia graminis f. sp. tritici]KAA1132103.1 hypothetical protein PGTUg99_037125 [Puccinia graminis f. sp. tritici]